MEDNLQGDYGDDPLKKDEMKTVDYLANVDKLKDRNKEFREGKFPWDDEVKRVLEKTFEHKNGFRENQLGIINATLSGRDCLGLIPTGGGKSLTF